MRVFRGNVPLGGSTEWDNVPLGGSTSGGNLPLDGSTERGNALGRSTE